MRWTLEVDTPAEALAVRDAMRVFFSALASDGPAAVAAALSPSAGAAEPPGHGGQESAA